MTVELQQILGTWRHTHDNTIIDFNIRNRNTGVETAKAMFTIYQRQPKNKILYEWHGIIEIVNHETELPVIQISEIHKKEDKPEYENLTIWMFTAPNEMYIELGNGDRVLFNRLGNFFS